MLPRHFGAILEWNDWHTMKNRLEAGSTDFIITLTTGFAGEVGEQMKMFFRDPSGNALEFKPSQYNSMIFAHFESPKIELKNQLSCLLASPYRRQFAPLCSSQ